MQYLLLSFVVISVLVDILAVCIGNGSNLCIFSMVHNLQMIVIIPMIGAYISDDVTTFIANLSISLLGFNKILPDNGIIGNKSTGIDYRNNNLYLRLIDFKSRSSLINCQGAIFILILLIGIRIVISQILKYTRKRISDTNSSGSSNANRFLSRIHKDTD